MSSKNSTILEWSKYHPILKKVFLYYNIYIRNLKFFFKNSQSQFGEDKKIIKLFQKDKKGIYLDIGCFHPIRQNNTYLMHKLGWKGINIDLNPLSIELFDIARPHDINICAALSNKKSTTTLYFDHSLSTLNTISKSHTFFLKKAFKLNKLKKRKIKTNTLTNLLKKNKIRKIDFMNIDIEDSELKVLQTINFNYFDIKVICIEVINQFKTKQSNINKDKIIKLLKKNNYIVKFKSFVNYVFVKNEKIKNN
jgi:FkbM family methyltransferase